MAGFRKRYYRNTGSRGIVKRARGNLRAARTNKDRSTFTINVSQPLVLSGDVISVVDGNGNGKNIQLGVQALNIWDVLARSENFQSFCRMYDQVSLDYVDVTLNVTNSTINTNEANTTYDVYTAWDRTGLSKEDLYAKVANNKYVGTYIGLGDKITSYTYQKTQLNAFQRWRQHKSISPSTQSEKDQIISTGNIFNWREPFNSDDLYYPMLEKNMDNEEWKDINFFGDNPAVFGENQQFPWKPTLLIGAFKSGLVQVNGVNIAKSTIPLTKSTKILMTADIKAVCTFRGQKGAQTLAYHKITTLDFIELVKRGTKNTTVNVWLYPEDWYYCNEDINITLGYKDFVIIKSEKKVNGKQILVFEVTFNNTVVDSSKRILKGEYYADLSTIGRGSDKPYFDDDFSGPVDVNIFSDLYKVVANDLVAVNSGGFVVKNYEFDMNEYQCRISSNYNPEMSNNEIPGRLQDKTEDITVNGQTVVTPDVGYSGLGEVTINTNVSGGTLTVENNKSVSVTSNGTTTVSPSTGFDALSSVTVNTNVQPNLESKTLTITSNTAGSYLFPSSGYDGISDVYYEVNVPTGTNYVVENNKSITISSNGIKDIIPSTGYDVMSRITANVDIQPNLENKTVSVTNNGTETVNCSSGYDGLGTVTINTNVSGLTPNLENKTVSITSNGTETVNCSSGYDGLGTVTINTNVSGVETKIRYISTTSNLNSVYSDLTTDTWIYTGSGYGYPTVSPGHVVFCITGISSDGFTVIAMRNNDSVTKTIEAPNNCYYKIFDHSSGSIYRTMYLIDNNNNLCLMYQPGFTKNDNMMRIYNNIATLINIPYN